MATGNARASYLISDPSVAELGTAFFGNFAKIFNNLETILLARSWLNVVNYPCCFLGHQEASPNGFERLNVFAHENGQPSNHCNRRRRDSGICIKDDVSSRMSI